jgi:hypothetical protein
MSCGGKKRKGYESMCLVFGFVDDSRKEIGVSASSIPLEKKGS